MIKQAYEAGELKALEDLKAFLEKAEKKIDRLIKHEKKEEAPKTMAMGVRG